MADPAVLHELLAMVGGEHHHGLVAHAQPVEVVEQPGDVVVGVGDLLAVETLEVGDVGVSQVVAPGAQVADVHAGQQVAVVVRRLVEVGVVVEVPVRVEVVGEEEEGPAGTRSRAAMA